MGRKYINHNQQAFHKTLLQDYFARDPTYGPETFRRRFRMSRPLFIRILESIQQNNYYFVFKQDAAKKHGLSGHQKMTAALRMLAYGTPADALDDAYRIAESTALENLDHFCQSVVDIYGTEYLRSPNKADVTRLREMHESKGWPGMLGSLDCMHWEWKNCPKAFHGAYNGKEKKPTIILEAVASHDLWIWHAFFGMPGSLNDLNVVERSHLFNDLAQGKSTPVSFTLGQNTYDHGYYLGDGIYPKWSTIVKTFANPMTAKQKQFAAMQEGQRKDVERTFGVLQARFAMVSNPCRLWKRSKMATIMFCCIILHNMIIEDERGMDYPDFEYEGARQPPELFRTTTLRNEEQYAIHNDHHEVYRNAAIHNRLQRDLMEHIWNSHGNQ